MSSRSSRTRVVLALAALAAASACGSSGSASPAGAAAPSSVGTSSAGAGGGSSASAAALARAYAGTVGTPPTTGLKPEPGRSVWIVSCGEQSVSCNTPTAAAVAAAKAVGWTSQVCDGKLNPAGWAACIRQGIAARPDAIMPVGLDCPVVQQSLVEAQKAGVKTIGIGGMDCSDVGGPKVYDGTVQYLPGMPAPAWWAGLGALRADYLIGRTNGHAKVLALSFSDAVWGPMQSDGFAKELATCSGCSIVKTLDIGNQDVVSGSLRTKFSTALLQNPTVNAISVPLDAWFTTGLAQAISSSPRARDLTVVGTFGELPNIDLIRSGSTGETASAGFSAAQTGWAGIDAAIRIFAGQTPVPAGMGFQVVDKGHNLPAAGHGYTPPVDFEAAYKKIWGVA